MLTILVFLLNFNPLAPCSDRETVREVRWKMRDLRLLRATVYIGTHLRRMQLRIVSGKVRT